MAVFDKRARRKATNALFIGFCTFAAALALVALAAILISLLINGAGGVNLAVFTQDTPAPGSPGGLRNAIVGSLMLCALGMVIAVVIGILAGTWLAEYAGRNRWTQAYGSVVRFVNDVLLSARPSWSACSSTTFWSPTRSATSPAGPGPSPSPSWPCRWWCAPPRTCCACSPRQLRESGVALGAPLWTTIRTILWRAASGGIITGALLAFARISGETAPLLFTSLNNQFFSLDMGKSMANLPVVIFNYALSAYDDWRRLAWVGSLLIAAAVLFINILVRVLSKEPRRS